MADWRGPDCRAVRRRRRRESRNSYAASSGFFSRGRLQRAGERTDTYSTARKCSDDPFDQLRRGRRGHFRSRKRRLFVNLFRNKRRRDRFWKHTELARYLLERLLLVGPMQRRVVESVDDGGFDDLEIGRDVEIARHVERGVADMQDFAARFPAGSARDLGQNWIAHRVERLRDQRRADDLGGIAGAERDHPTSPALRYRQRDQIAHQIDDVLGVVAEADPVDGVAAHRDAVLIGQPDRTADAGVIGIIFRQWRRGHAFADIGLDQHMRLAVGLGGAVDGTDIERAVRPGRLRQVFDDAGNPVVAFDQQHVAGLDHAAEVLRIARRERLVARDFLLQVARDQLTDGIEHDAHETFPQAAFGSPLFFSLIMVSGRCNLVHA
jgi:hypothetical protein